eukprot:CAMPEP_0168612782 /NCGR_PEP_ID=MMETSP0449_2-20121227/3100_1 /TAXON_ID=1082188 /ORGANISM="Strombidium rassoulzadegani, Strain ras09" /LENGTH=173 /DNA_ID=CAMNT_0008653369 /DNA_START=52 /DNA_END=569 /DNA_ORIENTATION=-
MLGEWKCSVVGGGSGLLLEELGVVDVALLDSIGHVAVLQLCLVGLVIVSLEHVLLPRLSALQHLDVVEVGVAKEEEATQERGQPAMAIVVEQVGLVPVRELAHVLVGVVCQIALLGISRNLGVEVLLGNIEVGGVGALESARVVEGLETPCSSQQLRLLQQRLLHDLVGFHLS